jgi:hypothetical protein
MSKETFEHLKKNIIEAGQMMRGERTPSREFVHEVDDTPHNDEKVWAVCITNEDDALTPLKLYEVRFVENMVSLHDDEGESLICPVEWFAPVNLAPESVTKIYEFTSV